MDRGEVAFTRMEKVIFGEDAAAAAKAEAQRLGAENVFLLVSGTLNRETDEIEKLAGHSQQVRGTLTHAGPFAP